MNWALLLTSNGLIVCRGVRPACGVVVLLAGLAAVLAIGWELGEWFMFLRHGTEVDTASVDLLGTLGALVAGWSWRALTRAASR